MKKAVQPLTFTAPEQAANGGHPYSVYKTTEQARSRRVWTPSERIAEWGTQGALVHEPTGLAKLDELTGGGPVYGSRWYWLGAPDACKTLAFVQTADVWTRRGIAVGLLAVDEEADDITTRVAQRAKFRRIECEERALDILREMAEALEACPLRMYGPEWTIEAAADDLAKYAEDRSEKRIALFVDSIQQVSCHATLASELETSPRELVNANVRALRDVATRYRMIVMATSEMNRNAYRSIEAAEASNDMAAAKESGAIEFSARVLVSLRSVKGHGDLVQARMVKNKHGTSWPNEPDFFFSIDRARQTLAMSEAPTADDPAKQASTDGVARGRLEYEAERVFQLVLANPGMGQKGLRQAAVGACLKIGKDRLPGVLLHLEGVGRIENRKVAHGQREDAHYHAVTPSSACHSKGGAT